MSGNRPFFSSFLSAFRVRSGVQKVSTSPTGGVSGASLSSAYAAAAAAQQAASQSQGQASQFHTTSTAQTTSAQAHGQTSSIQQPSGRGQPPSRTIGKAPATASIAISAPAPSQFAPQRHHTTSPLSRSPGSPGFSAAMTSGGTMAGRNRRGSDSSNEGFRDALGAEKWYIGGRTATGEERFYKLGMAKRPRSLDRLSMDRMSL